MRSVINLSPVWFTTPFSQTTKRTFTGAKTQFPLKDQWGAVGPLADQQRPVKESIRPVERVNTGFSTD